MLKAPRPARFGNAIDSGALSITDEIDQDPSAPALSDEGGVREGALPLTRRIVDGHEDRGRSRADR
jgi:hypothetical protein